MRNRQPDKERTTLAVIRSGRKKETLATWRYWEVVGALQWMGADRVTAYDTAKWIMKANAGDHRKVKPEITIDVIEKEI